MALRNISKIRKTSLINLLLMIYRILISVLVGLLYSVVALGQCTCTLESGTATIDNAENVTGGSWSCSGTGCSATPDPGDYLVINSGATLTISGNNVDWENGDGDPTYILVKDGGTMDIQGKLRLADGSGVSVEDGGTLTGNGADDQLKIGGGNDWKCGGADPCPATNIDFGAGAGPLPVTLTYFKADRSGRQVQLSWQTATEINNDYFEIQRSLNGLDFDGIARVSGVGNSNTLRNYTYQDAEAAASQDYYYRLKQVDYNEEFAYSRIQHVSGLRESAHTGIYLQRKGNALQITTGGGSRVEVGIYSSTGQLVWKDTRS